MSRKRPAPASSKPAAGSPTKHTRIIAMLRTPAGTTIASLVAATEWQQHSVRGFLAGVVRKKLGLRQPDAMQKNRRNGRGSTKMSVEDEIVHVRGLDLKGLRSRWQSVFQRQAPAHLTRHLLFSIIAYRLQADRFGDLDHATTQVLDRTVAKEAEPGDNYAAQWVQSAWRETNISYVQSDIPKSRIYLEALPLFTRGLVRLPDHPKLLNELRLLERVTHRGGKDSVDHARGGHDDYANAVCGVLRTLSNYLGFSLEAMLADGEEDYKTQQQASAGSWQRFRYIQHLRSCGVPI